MREAAVALLLGLGVGAAWLAATGLVRLRAALDRLHLVAFVNVASGAAFVGAALAQEGVGARPLKLLLLVLVSLLAGAGLSHAAGRALVRRAAAGEEE